MTTKAAVMATAAIAFAGIAVGLAALSLFVDIHASGAEQRAALLGQGIGMLCLIPLGVVWIMWAVRFRRERERRRQVRPGPKASPEPGPGNG